MDRKRLITAALLAGAALMIFSSFAFAQAAPSTKAPSQQFYAGKMASKKKLSPTALLWAMRVLAGLMLGSLRVLWPWPAGVDSTEMGAPGDDLVLALVLALAAFAGVYVVARYAQGLEIARSRPILEPGQPPPETEESTTPERTTA